MPHQAHFQRLGWGWPLIILRHKSVRICRRRGRRSGLLANRRQIACTATCRARAAQERGARALKFAAFVTAATPRASRSQRCSRDLLDMLCVCGASGRRQRGDVGAGPLRGGAVRAGRQCHLGGRGVGGVRQALLPCCKKGIKTPKRSPPSPRYDRSQEAQDGARSRWRAASGAGMHSTRHRSRCWPPGARAARGSAETSIIN